MLRWLTAPWRGEKPLWKVAVLFVPIPGAIILFLPWGLDLVGVPIEAPVFIVWLTLLLAYIVWAVVSLWRSARRSHPLIRYPAQILTVLLVISLVTWTLTPTICDYTARARVQEATNISNPARTALGIACSEGDLRVGMTHEELGLEPAQIYQGNYQSSMSASVVDSRTVTVTIVMKDIEDTTHTWFQKNPGVTQGELIVYTGTCGEGGMTWTVNGTVNDLYLPKI